jgi:DNA-binding NtrC family response regulator
MNTVLIIEPDKTFSENLVELLQLEGYNAIGTNSVSDAGNAIKRTQPKVIICDETLLEDEDIVNLYPNLKEAKRTSSIVILNNDGDSNDSFKEADFYIGIPFRDEELLTSLDKLTKKLA